MNTGGNGSVSGGAGGGSNDLAGLSDVGRDILLYRSTDASAPRGLVLFSEMPPERRVFI